VKYFLQHWIRQDEFANGMEAGHTRPGRRRTARHKFLGIATGGGIGEPKRTAAVVANVRMTINRMRDPPHAFLLYRS
jgi:hypothetical protein